MTDEQFLKAMKIRPEPIAAPAAAAPVAGPEEVYLSSTEVEVETDGAMVSMSWADLQVVLQANRALYDQCQALELAATEAKAGLAVAKRAYRQMLATVWVLVLPAGIGVAVAASWVWMGVGR